jgi:hypothetical protein
LCSPLILAPPHACGQCDSDTVPRGRVARSLMAMSKSPTRGHPKFPQAGRPDYDDTGVIAMRAAASLSR